MGFVVSLEKWHGKQYSFVSQCVLFRALRRERTIYFLKYDFEVQILVISQRHSGVHKSIANQI